MIRPKIATFLMLGFAYGALFFGAPISLAHVLHNRLDIVQDSVVLWLWLSLLFGIPGLALHGAVLGLRRAAAGLAKRSREEAGRALAWALSLYNLAFFLNFVLYGTTYDQYPFGELSSAWGMATYLTLVGVAVAAAVIALSILIGRSIARRQERLWRLVLSAAAIVVALHLLLPLIFKAVPKTLLDTTAASVRPLRDEARTAHKVFHLALDGADFRVIEPLMAAGELPNFRDFVDNGSWAPLDTIRRANSPEIWASIFTGRSSAVHGVLDFYRITFPGMKGPGIFPVHRTFVLQAASFAERLGFVNRRIVNRFSLSVPPLWEVIDDLGATIGVVDGYFFSIPARQLGREESWFFSYELGSLVARGGLEAVDPSHLALMVQPVSALQYFAPHVELADFDWQSKTVLSLLESESQPDYGQLYTHEPDSIQHRSWKWYQPELFFDVREADVALRGEDIPQRYRDFDEFLGQLQKRLDPDTTIIITSDHGHSPTIAHFQFYSQHRHGPPGILLMKGPSIRRGYELESAHVLDVMPTILHLLGFPVARNLAGQVLLEALQGELGEASSVRTIDSFDVFAEALEVEAVDEQLNRREIERLRALGYIP